MKRATFALLTLLLAGCTAHGRIGALPEIVQPADAAEIVVIREWRFMAAARTLSVTVDGAAVYGMETNEHVIIRVAPGYHVVGIGAPGLNEGTAGVQAVPQQRYYFRAESGFFGPLLQPIGAEAGQALMAKTSPIAR